MGGGGGEPLVLCLEVSDFNGLAWLGGLCVGGVVVGALLGEHEYACRGAGGRGMG